MLIGTTALGRCCAQVGNVLADRAQALFGRHAEGISRLRYLKGYAGSVVSVQPTHLPNSSIEGCGVDAVVVSK